MKEKGLREGVQCVEGGFKPLVGVWGFVLGGVILKAVKIAEMEECVILFVDQGYWLLGAIKGWCPQSGGEWVGGVNQGSTKGRLTHEVGDRWVGDVFEVGLEGVEFDGTVAIIWAVIWEGVGDYLNGDPFWWQIKEEEVQQKVAIERVEGEAGIPGRRGSTRPDGAARWGNVWGQWSRLMLRMGQLKGGASTDACKRPVQTWRVMGERMWPLADLIGIEVWECSGQQLMHFLGREGVGAVERGTES